ncbi:MAG: LytTR family transcriptional regulator [Clostridia bacterium]|nr:LytTR family transcriptional regulator [Clostridia bacterium]
MKFTLHIVPDGEEEVIVYAKEKSALCEKIRQTCEEFSLEIVGYGEKEAVKLSAEEIVCFTVETGKVWARTEKEIYAVKQRLYVLEEMLGEGFVKINQSCLARISAIRKFEYSFSCALKVVFKNGYTDYVSRRCIKTVKERVGIV